MRAVVHVHVPVDSEYVILWYRQNSTLVVHKYRTPEVVSSCFLQSMNQDRILMWNKKLPALSFRVAFVVARCPHLTGLCRLLVILGSNCSNNKSIRVRSLEDKRYVYITVFRNTKKRSRRMQITNHKSQ
jgi:hypothetical protein